MNRYWEEPAASIIMPAYNSGDYIGLAIESVRAQSFPNWELLISDDGSTDGTLERIQAVTRIDSRIRLLTSGINRGPASARNVAIEVARGRYIAFLDSDDLWKPQKLERQLAFMRERDVAFSFTSYDRIDENGRYIDTQWVHKPVTHNDLLKSTVIGCLTAVYDAERLGKIYMPDIRKRQDFGLWLTILKQTDAAYPLPESLAEYRMREGSVSSNKLMAAKYTWRVYREVEKLGLVRSAYYFVQYATNGFLKTYVRSR